MLIVILLKPSEYGSLYLFLDPESIQVSEQWHLHMNEQFELNMSVSMLSTLFAINSLCNLYTIAVTLYNKSQYLINGKIIEISPNCHHSLFR